MLPPRSMAAPRVGSTAEYGRNRDSSNSGGEQEGAESTGIMREAFQDPLGVRPRKGAPSTCDFEVCVEKDLFPQCIVWTPIHGCTWCFPFIGHMGIGKSNGEVWEFMGLGASRAPEGGLSFGPVCRYLQLSSRGVSRVVKPRNDLEKDMTPWDRAMEKAIEKVAGYGHGGCISNCHTFVALCLHEMEYGGIRCWNWMSYVLAVWVFVMGKFTTTVRTMVYAVPSAIAIFLIFVFFNSSKGS